VRDFSATQDVADAMAALLVAQTVTGPVNVASGRGESIAGIAEMLVGLTGAARDQLQLGALPARGEPPVMVADTSRLRDEVGFVPKASLQERLAEQVALARASR